MLKDIKFQEKIYLKYAIEEELNKVTRNIFRKKTKKLEEPDYIAALSQNFTKKFYVILNNFFYGYSFKITGIFCHQKPLAVFTDNSGRCEIGDLLFIYIYNDMHGNKYYNSLLLQAKISSEEELRLSSSDLQLRLYSEWPEFIYAKAGNLNNTKRNIMPKTFSSGAKYLLIDPDVDIFHRHNPFEYIYGTAVSHNPLYLSNQLAVELIDFINFKAGRTIEEKSVNTKDEWSRLVWDLFDITKNIYSRRVNIGFSKFPRTTVAGRHLYNPQGTLFTDTDNGNDNDNIPEDYISKEFGGFSVIVVEGHENSEQIG